MITRLIETFRARDGTHNYSQNKPSFPDEVVNDYLNMSGITVSVNGIVKF